MVSGSTVTARLLRARRPRNQKNKPDKDKDNAALLPGPKHPLWKCSCGTDGNFANWVTCRGCGGKAPKAIVALAYAAAERAVSGGSSSEGEGTLGAADAKADKDKALEKSAELAKAFQTLQSAGWIEACEPIAKKIEEDKRASVAAKALIQVGSTRRSRFRIPAGA